MNFLKTIKNSIYSPSFYKEVPKKSLGPAIRYFILLIVFLTVINLIFLFQTLVIETPLFMQNLALSALNCFPNELEIKISQGKASTNVNEPYFLTCDSLAEMINFNKTLAMINTKEDFSQTKFDQYKVSVWLTQDSIIARDSNYRTRLYSLKGIDDFKLNKESINSVYNQFSPYLKFVGPILLILTFLGILILYLFRFLQLLITASLIWLLGKIFKHELNFSSSYKIGIYAATLGLIVELIVNSTSRWTGVYGFPFMFTVITLGVVVINVFFPAKKN